MHTLIVIAAGFALLGIGALAGRVFGGASGTAIAAIAFLPVWCIGAAINFYVGVKRAGYSVKDEFPIFSCLRFRLLLRCSCGGSPGESPLP